MAEEQKPVEVPKEAAAPAVAEPAVETKPTETTEAAPAPAVEAAPVVEAPAATTEAPAAEATETPAAPAAEEPKKEEVVPVEEGQLEHKGLNFPKNFIYSKQFFWFGNDAVESKALSQYRRSEKSVEAGQRNSAWASQTGKGLLFFGEKSAPTGVINLSDATEPATDGPTKFHFTAGGHKHAFKAANTADRDNWVSQLKLKIAEAKELSSTVPESEAYKTTIASFKPAAPVKKEEPKKEEATEAPKEETAAPTEAPVAAAAATETPAATEEAPKEAAKEEPKRRSASRKRTSIFGSFFGQKDEKPTDAVSPGAETPKEETTVPAAATEPATTETAVAPVEAAAPAPAVEAAPTTEAAVEEKPVPVKRNSIFGVFGKKEKKAAETTPAAEPAKETEAAAAPASETAPVIPPVETSTPLGESVADATPAPAAATEAPKEEAAPVADKKDIKEKRKSSLPFAFGKKSPAGSDSEGEKTEKTGPFSKLRATIKARGNKPAAEKAEEKTEEKKEEQPAEAAPVAEAEATTSTKPAAEEPVNKPESAVAATPAVTAAA